MYPSASFECDSHDGNRKFLHQTKRSLDGQYCDETKRATDNLAQQSANEVSTCGSSVGMVVVVGVLSSFFIAGTVSLSNRSSNSKRNVNRDRKHPLSKTNETPASEV